MLPRHFSGMLVEGFTSGTALYALGGLSTTGGPAQELSRLGEPAGGPLLQQARAASAAFAAELGRGGDAVATARIEGAVLDFAREVRALYIGRPDVLAAERSATVDSALAAGMARAAELPSVGLDVVDRLVTILDAAARVLGDMPTPPLVASTDSQGA